MHAASVSSRQISAIIKRALKEDLPFGDITTNILFPSSVLAEATLIAHEPITIAGLEVATQVFKEIDPTLHLNTPWKDGDAVKAQIVLLTVKGDVRSILKGERVALNFLQHLSGIASLTAQFCQAVAGSSAKILDTRKTTPGMRVLEKWAVRLGGGMNHRQSLSDGILIKDNHLAILRSQGIEIDRACELARSHEFHKLKICVEAETLNQVKTAIKGKPDVVLLDNMTPETVKKAVKLLQNLALVEVSGGVNLKNVRKMADAGADFISIGALTHSARSADISLTLTPISNRGGRSRP